MKVLGFSTLFSRRVLRLSSIYTGICLYMAGFRIHGMHIIWTVLIVSSYTGHNSRCDEVEAIPLPLAGG